MTTYSYTVHTPLLEGPILPGGFRAEFKSEKLFSVNDLLHEDEGCWFPADDVPEVVWIEQGEGDFPLAYDGGYCIEVETSEGDYFELTPFGLSGWEPMFDPAEMTIKEQLELRKQNEEEQGA